MGKKITFLLVALALIVTSMVSFKLKGANSMAHAGNGTDKEIKNVGDLAELLGSVSYALDDGSTEDISNYYLKSATIHYSSVQKNESEYSYNYPLSDYYYSSPDDIRSRSGDSKGNSEIEVTVYITKDGLYVEAQGVEYSKSHSETTYSQNPSESKTNTSYLKYNYELYLTSKNAYLKINEWNEVSDYESSYIKAEYEGKWMKISGGMSADLLVALSDAENSADYFSQIINTLIMEDMVKEKDNGFSFNENELSEVFGYDEEDLDDYNITLDADLSDKKRPSISISGTYKYDESEMNSSSSGKSKSDSSICVYNVNNTVIKFDSSVADIKIDNSEDFENIFVTKEYKED